MVVLTIVAQKNGEAVYFDEPIPQVHYMRLVSCSLYNSWHNLKRVGMMFYKTRKYPHNQHNHEMTTVNIAEIPQGHYNLLSLVRELKSSLAEYKSGIKLQFETDAPNTGLEILNPVHDEKQINVTHDLAKLLGTGTKLSAKNYVKKLKTPSSYFIHCNLIDPTKNFFNGKRSKILAQIDVTGSDYDKVTYHSPPQECLRDCYTGQHVNQITLSVEDEDGDMLDFNGLPIEFVLELN